MNHKDYLKRADLETILSSIKEWKNEAKNFRNDGWVQEGYREKLKKVFAETGTALRDIKNSK